MPKVFDKDTKAIIKDIINDFKRENPQISINTDNLISSFEHCYELTEGDPSGNASIESYKLFYNSTLKNGMVASTKMHGVNDKDYIFTIDNFNNYEKFMRGLFETYVKPEFEDPQLPLSFYGFGCMISKKYEKILTSVQEVNAYQCYKLRKNAERDNNTGAPIAGDIVEYIDQYRSIYGLNNKSINHADQASYMALLYKDLKNQYNEMSGFSKWFTKAGWSRWWTLKQAKSYIQDRRSTTEKNETTFDAYISNEVNATVADYSALSTAVELMTEQLEDVQNNWNRDPNYDCFAQTQDNPIHDLYGSLTDESEMINTSVVERTRIQDQSIQIENEADQSKTSFEQEELVEDVVVPVISSK